MQLFTLVQVYNFARRILEGKLLPQTAHILAGYQASSYLGSTKASTQVEIHCRLIPRICSGPRLHPRDGIELCILKG